MIHWLGPDDPRWLAALAAQKHDLYHLPGYCRVEATRMLGEPVAILAQHGGASVFVPLILRTLGDKGRDAISPYGYPCPLFWGDPADVSGAVQELVSGLASADVCCAFVRLHPLLVEPVGALEAAEVVTHGTTVFMDLAAGADASFADYSSSTRRKVRKALKEGYAPARDPDWEHLDDFVRLYHATMTHVGAAPWYFFDRAYFERLREATAGHLHLIFVEHDGVVVSAGLYSVVGELAQYHLGGSDAAHSKRSPMVLQKDFARRFALQAGARVLHLGGGLGAEDDSLFSFKSRFSSHRATFRSWRPVCDEVDYQRRVAKWERTAGQKVDPHGFFPAYRRPLPAHPGDR